jgi:hypothetical protein
VPTDYKNTQLKSSKSFAGVWICCAQLKKLSHKTEVRRIYVLNKIEWCWGDV